MMTSSHQCSPKELNERWSKISKKMGCFYNAPSTQHYREMEISLFKTYFGNLQGKKLLKLDLWNEVNNTRILIWAAQQGAEIYGLDVSDYIVNSAKKNFEEHGLKANLIRSDVRNIKFPSNNFDFVYTMGTIEHIPDYEKALKEIYRVLKPGGKAIIGSPNKWDPFLFSILIQILIFFNKFPYAPEKCFSMKEFKKLIEKNNFEIIDDTSILFVPGLLRIMDIFFYKKAKVLCCLTKMMLAPFRALEKKKIFKKHGHLIVCVCKK